MGWGGGFGGGGAGPPMGGGGRPGAPGAGLPFGGIPHEMQGGVDALLAEEPERDRPAVTFTHRPNARERRRLSLWHLLTEYRGMLLLAGVLVAIVSLSQQAGPKLIEYAINDGMTPPHHDIGVIGLAAGLYLISVAVTGLSQREQVKVTGRLAAWVMNDLRVRIFTHLQRLSLDFFTAEKAGVVMTRMTSDIENLQQLLQDGLAQFALQVLTMAVITVILFTTNVELALITVVLVVPALTALSLWFRRASERGYSKVRDGIALVLADLSESLQGVRIVTAHNRQRHNVVRHRNVVGHYRDANDYTAQINAVYGPGTQLLGFLGQGALLAIGGEMVLNHQLTLGALVAFFLYLNRFLQPIQLLVQQYNTFQQGQSSIVKLRSLLETEPTVPEAEHPVELPPVRGEIGLQGVSFSYDGVTEVLHDVDLVIQPGETVSFVGETGAGKSTIAKLVSRFYDPSGGRVLIDGHDLRDVSFSTLRHQLGVVPQEPFLFAGTIRDNVAFGRPDAPIEEVREAVRRVGLDALVGRLPDGLDSIVHERGQSLSSGERQLIALTRAFLAQPRILVLDEATSNLDLKSETAIEAALDVLLENRTAILIAHRLSTAMRADRIVVIDDGRVVEVGSHEELVEAGGRYAAMFETWTSHGGAAPSTAGSLTAGAPVGAGALGAEHATSGNGSSTEG